MPGSTLRKHCMQNQAKLWTLMGLPSGESPAISGKLDTEVTMTKSLVDLKQLAMVNRPDIKALEAEKGEGDADIILAEAEGVPNLTAGLSIPTTEEPTQPGQEKRRSVTTCSASGFRCPFPSLTRIRPAFRKPGPSEAAAKAA